MKTILKFSKLLLFTFLIVNITSCEKEDYLIFTAINQKEVKFQNEFQDVYKISNQTSNNISERLVWNAPDFDAPTTVTYVVDISTNSDFSTIDMSSGDTSNNHLGLKVSSMLEFAETLGLDDDPNTTFSDGTPNNTGMVYVRVTAYAGTSSSGANQSSTVSKTASMNIEVLENVGACTDSVLSNWGLVGSAVNGWGGTNRGFAAGNDVPFLSNGQDGMFRAVATLYDGEFKIREDNAWGLNYGDDGADGTLEQNGANITISEGHYIIDFDAVNFTPEDYKYFISSAEKKAETETELAVLKSALEGNDLEAIKAATEKVATVSQSLGAALYAATAAAEGAATPNEDGVEDAEIVDEGK